MVGILDGFLLLRCCSAPSLGPNCRFQKRGQFLIGTHYKGFCVLALRGGNPKLSVFLVRT
jgi:hypothetical protein